MNSSTSLGWNARLQSEYEQQARGLSPGRIIAVDRDSYLIAFDLEREGSTQRATLSGRLRHLGQHSLAVGDWVGLHESRIDYLFTRSSCFRRKRSGISSDEQVIAANIDLALIATSLNEDFSPRRVERFVVAAWDAGATPIVLLTKCDLADDVPDRIATIEMAAPGCEVLAVSSETGEGIDELRDRIGHGQSAVLIGSSGIGKSTLVNRLLGEDRQLTQSVRHGDDKGRHTTTRRELVRIPSSGGLIIDTPGIREFGVLDANDGAALEMGFSDIEALAEQCGFRDCSHRTEPSCALLDAIEEGVLDPARLESYFKLQREMAYNEMRHDKAKLRQAGRDFSHMVRQVKKMQGKE